MPSIAQVQANQLLLSDHDNDELVLLAQWYDELFAEDATRALQLAGDNSYFIVANCNTVVPAAYVAKVYPLSKPTLDLENKFFTEFEDVEKQSIARVEEMLVEVHAAWQALKPYVSTKTQNWIDKAGYTADFVWYLTSGKHNKTDVFDYCTKIYEHAKAA